jgi:hypothetical protein
MHRWQVISAMGGERWESELSTRIEDYLKQAQECETLAMEAKDAVVKAALLHAAQHWRDRARLVAQHADDERGNATSRHRT